MPRRRRRPPILDERQFRLLFAGQAVSLLGDGMVNVALAFAILELGGSDSAVGIVFAARLLALAAALLAGGVVADRTSRRTTMVLADLARLGSQAAIAALLIADAGAVWSIAVLSAVTGAATGFFNPASVGLLPAIVPADRLQAANGLRASAMAAGEILGPAVAGLLVLSIGAGWALAIDAMTYAASAALLSRMLPPAPTRRTDASFASDLRDGWQAFRSRRWVWSFVVAIALGSTMWGAWLSLGPLVSERELGGVAAWSAATTALGAGGLIGGMLAMRSRPRRPLVAAALAFVVFPLPLAMLASGAPVAILALGAALAGGALMFGNSVWESTLQRHVPPESLSRVSSYDWFGTMLFMPLGLALWATVAGTLGLSTALWVAFCLQVVTALAPLAIRDVRRLGEDATTSTEAVAPRAG